MTGFKRVNSTGLYRLEADVSKEEILKFARKLLAQQFRRGCCLDSVQAVQDYLRMKMASYEHEVFAVLYADNQHRLLAFEELFSGTIDGCNVYPRVVAKQALIHNAAAIICVHNHPSGSPEPSAADRYITKQLKETLQLIDVRLLDHFVLGGDEVVSFAERGLL